MKVFFAIPMYRGKAHPECAKSLESTLKLLIEKGYEVVLGTCSDCCYIQFARNRLVRDFMQTDADALFFVDDDISWTPEDALKLIESQHQVIAGVYRFKMDKEDYPTVIFTDSEQKAQVNQDGTIRAAGVPAGMLRIKREAIEKLIAAHPEKSFFDVVDGEKVEGFYDLFPQGVYGDRWVGEDMAFCQLWRDLGGRIAVLPDMTIGHHAGDESWIGNYHEFLLRQPGGSKAA